jgi:NADPH-dependent 2,4-dienoyl-CoA reductase/sulfur reductase-like enzyme
MSALPVVVLGAGPAGLAAAEAVSAAGTAVIVIDDNPVPGGQIWRGGAPAWQDRRARTLWNALRARAHVSFRFGTRVLASAGPHQVLLDGPDGPHTLAWDRIIVCSGARELLLPFPGWTLPGVTGAGGLQALAKGGVPVQGKRVVVAGTGPLLLAVAETLRRRGALVAAIVEHRSQADLLRFGAALALSHPAKLAQAIGLFARLRGTPYLHGATLTSAQGDTRLRAVTVVRAGVETTIACDFAAVGYGLLPSLDAAAMLGCATRTGAVVVDDFQRTSIDGIWAAGESTGIGGVDKALAEGAIAGRAACGLHGSTRQLRARASARDFAALLTRSFAPAPQLAQLCSGATIVCRCEDVRAADLTPHGSWRAAKLQTRLGMGPCQGRVCGAACGFLYGWDASNTRPPAFPASAATLASLAGDEA